MVREQDGSLAIRHQFLTATGQGWMDASGFRMLSTIETYDRGSPKPGSRRIAMLEFSGAAPDISSVDSGHAQTMIISV